MAAKIWRLGRVDFCPGLFSAHSYRWNLAGKEVVSTLLEAFQKAEQRALPGDFGKKESASKDCEIWLLLTAACCKCSAESCGGYFPAIFPRRGEDSAHCLMQNKAGQILVVLCDQMEKWTKFDSGFRPIWAKKEGIWFLVMSALQGCCAGVSEQVCFLLYRHFLHVCSSQKHVLFSQQPSFALGVKLVPLCLQHVLFSMCGAA